MWGSQLEQVLSVVDDLFSGKCSKRPAPPVKPLDPDPVVDVLDLQLPFSQQRRRAESLVDLFGLLVLTIDEGDDMAVQNLHHVLLVPHSIDVQELLWQGPDAKRPLEVFASGSVDIRESDFASVFIGEDAHHIGQVRAHPEAILGATLTHEADIPGVFGGLGAVENLCVQLISHFNAVKFGRPIHIVLSHERIVESVIVAQLVDVIVEPVEPLIIVTVLRIKPLPNVNQILAQALHYAAKKGQEERS